MLRTFVLLASCRYGLVMIPRGPDSARRIHCSDADRAERGSSLRVTGW
jgi:hypothetical protein